MSFRDQNKAAWNALCESGSVFAKIATDEECRTPLQTLDSRGWLPATVEGLDVLCLAAGGGWQSILYALAGARVTVVDLSPGDARTGCRRSTATRRECACGRSVDGRFVLSGGCVVRYRPSTGQHLLCSRHLAVFREIARVSRPGGLYISQHKQPTSLQIAGRDAADRYVIGTRYYRSGALPVLDDTSYRERGTLEYLHRWEDLVGGLCRAGFVIEDLREPFRGDETAPVGHYKHRGLFTPPYVRLKARRLAGPPRSPAPTLWTPS